jgi:hypothetical protein
MSVNRLTSRNIPGRGDFGHRESSKPSMTDAPTWISLKG